MNIEGFVKSLELHPLLIVLFYSSMTFSKKYLQVLPFFVFSALCCFSETFLEFILSRKGQQQGKGSMHRMPVYSYEIFACFKNHMQSDKIMCSVALKGQEV